MGSQKVLVTGGAGFIGSHLVEALLERGAAVRVLDNFSTGSQENLAAVLSEVDLLVGDLRDLDACRAACLGVDTVFHLGALGSVPRSIDDPITSNAVNAVGTLNLLVAAREAGVRRFVLSSSSSVYGDTPTLPKHEGMSPAPRSPYAASKLAAEEYCRAFHTTYGTEAVALRYFNVFGPRQNPNSQYAALIPRFLTALTGGGRPVIHGDGFQSRDFTYVANVVEANLLAAKAPADLAAGRAFNIACGDQLTVLQILETLSAHLGVEGAPDFLPPRGGDVRHSRADISAAERALGYHPTVRTPEGLARTVRAFVEKGGRVQSQQPSTACDLVAAGVKG